MRTFFVSLLLFSFAPLAMAWGPQGHQTVAELAELQLRPPARAEVARLLADEPMPTLAAVSSWADEVRADKSQAVRTSGWHFINFKGGDCGYAPARDCPDGNCVIAAINRNFLALADRNRPDSERRDALKFLVHFVADVHQPLHASPKDDEGGNEFQVSYQGKGSNLHKVWDSLILRHDARSPADYADALNRRPPLPADPTRQSDRPAVDWAVESCHLVESGGIYPPGHVISDDYLNAHRAQAELRLRQAGSRLADMLNFALAPTAR
ncbi:MAG: S1/P1 nuclease [Arenimonas sp.]|nr:S1/P1 nuclease [Arenimonas sp.]